VSSLLGRIIGREGSEAGNSGQKWEKTEGNSIKPTKKWENTCFLP
jgi:hypothetical protein